MIRPVYFQSSFETAFRNFLDTVPASGKLILLCSIFFSYVCDEVSKKVRDVYLMLTNSFDLHCRHIDGILMCYEKIYKSINVDQPKADVFSQGESGFTL